MHPDTVGDLVRIHAELESGVAGVRDISSLTGTHHQDPGGRELVAQLETFRDCGDTQRARSRPECSGGHVDRTVAVPVRLDHGPELRAVEGLQQRAYVAPHGAEVDRDLRTVHACRGESYAPAPRCTSGRAF